MNTISFMTANFVARQLNYNMIGDWGQGDRATNAFFKPLDTYHDRLDAMLAEVDALGFEAIDLWQAHLNFEWATDEHVAIAKQLLDKYSFSVSSIAGWFGGSAAELERSCQIAHALDCNTLGGSTSLIFKDRPSAVAIFETYDVRMGFENHPAEKTAADVLAKIGDGGNGRIGACVDTGWFGTHGYDAAQALRELEDHLFHVHLKDVLMEGEHHTCAYGDGVVPIEQCVHALRTMGYAGDISIEHEPEFYDPSADCAKGLQLVREWLGA